MLDRKDTPYMQSQSYTIEEYVNEVQGYTPAGQTRGKFVRIFVPRYFNCLVFNRNGSMSVDVAKTDLMDVLTTAGKDENVTRMLSANMRGYYMFFCI